MQSLAVRQQWSFSKLMTFSIFEIGKFIMESLFCIVAFGRWKSCWRCFRSDITSAGNGGAPTIVESNSRVVSILPLMALNSLYCADVPLSSYSLTLTVHNWSKYNVFLAAKRTTWSSAEKAAIASLAVGKKKPPTKQEIAALQQKHHCLSGRDWRTIKFRCWAASQQHLRKRGKMITSVLQ